MKLWFLGVFILLLGSNNVYSAGMNTGLVLLLSSSARDEALCGAGAAVNSDVSAAMTNPAGLATIKNHQLLLFSIDSIADTHYQGFSYSQPTRIGNFAFSVGLFDGGEGYIYMEEKPPERVHAQRDNVYCVSYGKEITENFSVGIGLKYLDSKFVQRYKFRCFAGDVGMQFSGGIFKVGVAIRNLSGKVSYLNLEKDYLPMMLSSGLLISLEKLKQNLVFSVSKVHQEDIVFAAGLEYNPIKSLTLRGGYNLAHNLYSVGLGINLARVNIDYAYVPQRDLKNEHRISLKINFP